MTKTEAPLLYCIHFGAEGWPQKGIWRPENS